MVHIERFVWAITTVFLLASGLYFTIKLRGVQFKFHDMLASFKKNNQDSGISPFQSLTMTLGARIGVGSLAGMALAIYYGGPGTIFWIWISTIFCASNAFSESLLGVLYRKKEGQNYIGGPSYYIEKGLKNKTLSNLYAIVLIIAYVIGFLTVQSNTMVRSITEIFTVNSLVVAVIISFLSFLIIYKGLKRIATFSAKLVPFMTIGYIIICFYIIFINFNSIPDTVSLILTNIFHPPSISLGILTPLIIGFQRGIFSNEAGLGTGAIASASANTDSPSKQGFIQVLGIYIETIILTTLTAFVILLSNYNDVSWHNINGIELTQFAFVRHLGPLGNYVIMIAILLFAFSTIITGYYYGESNLKFLFKNTSNKLIMLFKIFVFILLIIGGISSPKIIWGIADILIVFLGIINVYSIFKLKKDVIKEYKYYCNDKK